MRVTLLLNSGMSLRAGTRRTTPEVSQPAERFTRVSEESRKGRSGRPGPGDRDAPWGEVRCSRSSDSAVGQPRRKPPPIASGCSLAAASRSLQPRRSEHSPGQRQLNSSPSGREALGAPAERRVESGVMCSCSAPPPDPSLPVPPLFPPPPFPGCHTRPGTAGLRPKHSRRH